MKLHVESRARWGGENGVVLIVVLWVFIFLFVVAFDFSTSAREEAAAAHRFNDETMGYYLAVAGFERGMYHYLNQQAEAGSSQQGQKNDLFDGAWREESLGAGMTRVRLVDEGGKININRASEETLRRVFTNLAIDNLRRDILIDSIMDWRDPDDLHRANGAENDYYMTRPSAYTAKNGPFDTVDDLLWVRGITPALYFGYAEDGSHAAGETPRIGLRNIFTVDSPIDRVNLRTASAEVIFALTGIPLDKCRAFVEERKKLSEKALGDLLPLLGINPGDATLQMFIFTNPSVVAVEAEGRLADSRLPRRVKGIVRLGGGQGFEILRWLDRDFGQPKVNS